MRQSYHLTKVLLLALLAIFLAATPATMTATEYIVDDGDVLQINVYDHEDMTTTVRVSGRGTIIVPLLGQMKVEGLTIPQISEMISTALSGDYIIDPQVNVFITKFRAQNIFVNGQVKNPGAFEFENGMTMVKAITLAGSFTELAAKDKVQIIRETDGIETILENTRMDESILPGDVIIIPESILIFISGQINKPDAYQLEADMTLIKLVSKAGGFTDLAAKGKVKIIRQTNGEETTIEKAPFNIPILPGDVIIVPESFF
ncbi:MAG: SLBB domain-containing protein [Thermodesulfobacteriota bacterium]